MKSQKTSGFLKPSAAIKPYTSKDLAMLYGVGKKTLSKWIEPFQEEVGQRHGRYYTIAQVKMIFDRIGSPEGNAQS